MENEEEQRMPMIGDRAPEFRAMTTKGKLNFPEDYKGSWVVFFSHPADFTPVCTTEFIEFARRKEEFDRINTKCLGLSIDSLSSHLGWIRSVESIDWKNRGKVTISFPIVADVSMNVAKKYGMLHSVAKTQTVRAVFIIDPEGVIRSILYYPMSTGRNIDEILRMIVALQLHDETGVATPEGWQCGDDALLGAPMTLEEADARKEMGDDVNVLEWYLATKKVK